MSSQKQIIVLAVFVLLLSLTSVWIVVYGTKWQTRNFQLNSFPAQSLGPRAEISLSEVDAVHGVVNGEIHLKMEFSAELVPMNVTEVEKVQVKITGPDNDGIPATVGPIQATTGLFSLSRDNPVSNYFSGTTTLSWRLDVSSTSSTKFPFDSYRVRFTNMTAVAFGLSNLVHEVDLIDIRIGNTNLVTTNTTESIPTDSASLILIELTRPWPLKLLFVLYAGLAVAYVAALAYLDAIKNWSAAFIGLMALFGTRETLTRGVDLYPNLVDYALLFVFAVAGYTVLLKALALDDKTDNTPTH